MDVLGTTDLQIYFTYLLRLGLAALFGGLVGLEREVHGRPAGFRTHLLVALGACLMMLVSEQFYYKYQALSSDSMVRVDPARVAAQIVTGIGFLGAGAIIKHKHTVRGLTTAACLWVVAGIGMAVGIGMYVPALMVTVIALVTLLLLKRSERWLGKESFHSIQIHCEDSADIFDQIQQFFSRHELRMIDCGFEKDSASADVCYRFVVARFGVDDKSLVVKEISQLTGVKQVRFN
jgi:putative Mg2+ transporter-C (MgtC) family protein